MNQNPPQGQQINIELGEKEAEGIYSNLSYYHPFSRRVYYRFYAYCPWCSKSKSIVSDNYYSATCKNAYESIKRKYR